MAINDLNDDLNLKKIDSLKKRVSVLNEMKIREEANLSIYEKELKNLTNQAKEIAGTDNIEELKNIVQNNSEKNTKLIKEYEDLISNIEEKLSQF